MLPYLYDLKVHQTSTSVDENGDIIGIGNAYEQTKYIFQKIEK